MFSGIFLFYTSVYEEKLIVSKFTSRGFLIMAFKDCNTFDLVIDEQIILFRSQYFGDHISCIMFLITVLL